jgi:tetratricopeptide (TPR) repeat protein
MSPRILIVIASVLVAGSATPQTATINEVRRTLRTYPFSDPDPVPILARNPVIYPYFSFDGYTEKEVDRVWNTVRLQNDYITADVLPEVGGKVLGAMERTTGREFVYTNDALKFRRIALRGPWTSGGIEFNFGVVGHAPSTASPVDYVTRRNPDGSVTCFVGTLDLPSRTRWTVAISLPKDAAYLETKAFWYNPTPYEQSYYSWSTAAVSAREDLHYSYPGNAMVQHTTSTSNATWPADREGRDLSWYRNNMFEGSKSYFVFGELADYFAAIADDEKFGLGHWARYDDMPGRKVWIWSLFRDGGIWENLLTDGKGQYSEPQAGRLFSQVDHEFFPPYTGDAWRELWFPVKDIGGISAASPAAVMNVSRKGDSISVKLCALQDINDDLLAESEGREVFRTHTVLRPMQTTPYAFRCGPSPIRVSLGNTRLVYDEMPSSRAFHRPVEYRLPGESSPEQLYLSGEFAEKQRQFEVALDRYRTCLLGEASHFRALVRVAGLYGRRGEYEKGLEFADRALRLSKFDPSANYIYGVLSRAMGRLVDARETYGWAARSLEFRSNAFCQIAEILIAQNDFPAAEEYARKSLDFNRYNSNAHLALAISLRKLGKKAKARGVLANLADFDPLNHEIRVEESWLDNSPGFAKAFSAGIRTEIAHETYLEIATHYLNMGLRNEAVWVLRQSPPSVMVYYRLADLLKGSAPDQSRTYMVEASKLSPEFVFPFREEDIPLLRWVISVRPADWRPRYFLGLLFWGKGRNDEALALLNDCRDPDSPTFYLARASLKKDREGVLADLEKALNLDPGLWRVWHHLVAHLEQSGDYDRALALAREANRTHPDQIVLRMDFATALYNKGQFADCLGVLNSARVLPYEGSWEAQDLYLRANLRSGISALQKKNYDDAQKALQSSREFPEHLGSGMPYEPDYRIQDYLLSVAQSNLGRRDSAQSALRRISEYTMKHRFNWGSEHLFGLLALDRLGEKEQLETIVNEWRTRTPEDPYLLWWLATRNGDSATVESIEKRFGLDQRVRLRFDAARMN